MEQDELYSLLNREKSLLCSSLLEYQIEGSRFGRTLISDTVERGPTKGLIRILARLLIKCEIISHGANCVNLLVFRQNGETE